ncbi:MAG: phage replisome organizer N-terminal domain-containing protein, partial [Lachnospiraceae bacterium]|nr:phage replisome organizer N-terminal domain-containing protein [Lachnospiraceae bacterium]
YYWLKLKADWFSDKRIKKLRSIAGGDTHTIIYLKMMLLSLKDEGKLYFEGAENVKLTLAFLQRHGLIEIGDDDEYQLTEVPTIIGSETASTIRSRECRERKKQLALGQEALQCNTNETGCNNLKQICRVERELEIERDKEIEKEGEKEKDTPASAAYGRFCNVFLSDAEINGLKSELPDKWEYYIDRLSVHIASSGKKYNSHAATIYKWAQEDAGKALLKKGMPDYSYSEEDSL